MFKSVFLVSILSFSLHSFAADSESTLKSERDLSSVDVKGSSLSQIIPFYSGVFSSFTGPDAGGNDTRFGSAVGLLVDFGKNRNWAFETGFIYRKMGSTTKQTDSRLGTFTADLNSNYLSFPLILKSQVGAISKSTFYVKAGLLPSLLTSSDIQFSTQSQTMNAQINSQTQNTNLFNSSVLDAEIGAGAHLGWTENTNLNLDVSYLRGLTSATTNSLGVMYNTGFLVTAGLGVTL